MAIRDPRKAAALSALAAWALAAPAADIHVPGDQPTIQQGIAAANNGDRVLVAPGTYAEHIDFLGKQVVLQSTGGAAVTTIDGTHSGIVVTMVHGEPPGTVLRGFTITGGLAGLHYGQPDTGGAIRVEGHAAPLIEENDIHHNLAHDGGAIGVSYASPTIRDNRIHDNRLTRGHWGGAIFVSDVGATVIEHNLIYNNRAPFGGGVSVHGFLGAVPKITRNVIAFNQATNDGGGLEVWINAHVVDNLVHGNQSPPGAAAGITAKGFLGTENDIVFINNTIADNRGEAVHVDVEGGQVVFHDTLVQTTVGTASIRCSQSDGGTAVFGRSLVFAPNGATIQGNCDVAGGGLLTDDPLFRGPGQPHPYELQDGSPAIDAGDDAYVAKVRRDLAGKPRVQGASVDLGAYEHPADSRE
jgi:hypothetical protein